jgi:hypothetical protein
MKIFGTTGYSQAYILMDLKKEGIITLQEFGKYDGTGSPEYIAVPQGKEGQVKILLSTSRWAHRIEE